MRPSRALLATAVLAVAAGAQTGEKRKSISNLPTVINRPGSYVVTTDILADRGITITSDDVTLDLDGNTIIGTGERTEGIVIDGRRENITILNGTVRNWGGTGIDAGNAVQSRFQDLELLNNDGFGLVVGREATVTRCSARGNLLTGIVCDVNGSLLDCTAQENLQHGMVLREGTTVIGSAAMLNTEDGIVAGDGVTVTESRASLNQGDGIEIAQDGRITSSTFRDNGFGAATGAGIHVTGSRNHLEDNVLVGNDFGLQIMADENVVSGNFVRDNTTNYDIRHRNQLHITIAEIPEVVSWPATVRLHSSLTGMNGEHGLVVAASDVTIELGGFSLVGVPGSFDGIFVVEGARNVSINGGSLRDWGTHGVRGVEGLRLRDVEATRNGLFGLAAGEDSEFVDCRVSDNGVLRDPQRRVRGGGISGGARSTVLRCTALGNNGSGIDVGLGSAIDESVARDNSESGLRLAGNSSVQDSTASDNGRAGIEAGGDRNRIDGNHVRNNAVGIDVPGSGSLVVRNTATGNESDFRFADENAAGRVVRVTGPISFDGIDPWANLRY